MPPWITRPTLEIDLSLPLARRFDTVDRSVFSDARRLLTAVMRDIPPRMRMLAYAVQLRTGNRFQREAAALAHLAGVDWRDVILANISYDLVLASLGCSTVALPSPSGPVLARNMDWWPEDVLAQSSYLIRCGKRGELSFAHAGWPAAIGVVSGLSGRGFGVVLNAVSSPEGADRTGYPVLLHLRRVLEDAVDFDQALMMLTNQRLCAGALFTLVGVKNEQRVVIERTCRHSALRWPRAGEPLVATNDYRAMPRARAVAAASPQAENLEGSACGRYDALCRHFAEHRANEELSDSRLLYALSDPQVIQGITAQHVILRPRKNQIALWVPRRLLERATDEVQQHRRRYARVAGDRPPSYYPFLSPPAGRSGATNAPHASLGRSPASAEKPPAAPREQGALLPPGCPLLPALEGQSSRLSDDSTTGSTTGNARRLVLRRSP